MPEVTPDPLDDLPDWVAVHLHEAAAERLRKRAAKAALRAQHAEARAYGLPQRHARKLRRNRAGDTKENAMDRNRCHVIGQHTGQQCTGEPLDPTPEAEIKICTRHAGLVLELVNHAKTAHFTSKETEK